MDNSWRLLLDTDLCRNEVMMQLSVSNAKLAIIGLGYVGLPLAVAFGRVLPVVGYDISVERINELSIGRHDRTWEVADEALAEASHLTFTVDPVAMESSNVYIVTTPTPIDEHKNPDLTAILGASAVLAKTLNIGDVVIYESTVYPGVTEDECVPVLERVSGLRFNEDFFVGYSPERINPGDKVHRLETIVKVTSGSTPACAQFVDDLYRLVVTAGTHRAPSIKVAEAAKVIENTQRDVNIALINELAVLFNTMGVDTQAVLDAAGSKWNFLSFRPGLVGGHCIGVDPYYLTFKAESVGHNPEVILAGRRINDSMGDYVAGRLIKTMSRRGLAIAAAKVLVMGLTFKENTPDLRNTRVVDIIDELIDYGVDVDVTDPWVNAAEAHREYGLTVINDPAAGAYDAVIIAVAHQQFVDMGAEGIRSMGKPSGSLIFDLKYVLSSDESDLRL